MGNKILNYIFEDYGNNHHGGGLYSKEYINIDAVRNTDKELKFSSFSTPLFDISLEIKDPNTGYEAGSLNAALDSYFKVEKVKDYKCEICKSLFLRKRCREI